MSNHPYCIGCKHLAYEDKQLGCGSTYTGSWTIEQASMFCKIGHWKQYFSSFQQPDAAFEKAMEHAANCKDFEERT